ncbi:hypothetical protein BVC80_339g11 [Macleaya cordata]|uniref:Chlorophyll A-B binding protein n=1 Tax=Macleaya cordata TaxID=56857 RepID=A0A200QC69_MACCD|nr:hypothetical protein BVC80_339g11 [Macleaya cordata]
MASAAARAIFCELQPQKPVAPKLMNNKSSVEYSSSSSPDSVKIFHQPRVCNLRSYGSDRAGIIRTPPPPPPLRRGRRRGSRVVGGGGEDDEYEYDHDYDEVSPFFDSLTEYIDNSRKSQDIEILSGRLSMVVIAATVTMELITGDSLFQKMDLQEIVETAGVCLAAVIFSAVFAYFSSSRSRVGRIFNHSCNTFIDLFIDTVIEGLFFESEPSDWSDDL